MARKIPQTESLLGFMKIWREQGMTEPERKLLLKMVCGNEMTPDELEEIEEIKSRVRIRSN